MAASMSLGRNIITFARTFVGISRLGSRGRNAFRGQGQCAFIRCRLPLTSIACIHTGRLSASIASPVTVTEEPDALFQKVSVLVKGHDKTVLDSYEFFATLAANELGITLSVFEPPRNIERLTLLKSVHIFKKHRVQYEMRTHYRCIELYHVTGCTTRVYLEYIQRNLPEGVAMEVTKTAMEKIPEHIMEPMWKDLPSEENISQSEDLPSGEMASQSEELPSVETVSQSEELLSGETASQSEELPSGENTSQSEVLPSGEKTSQSEDLPSGEKTRQSEDLPSGEKTSQSEDLPSGEKTSQSEDLPSGEKTSQ